MEYGNPHSPSYYMSAYNYGDLIHWDRKRQTVEEWEQNAFQRDWQWLSFVEAARSLAYLYIGFGQVVRAAIDT